MPKRLTTREIVARRVAEKDWQAQVVKYATLRGWRVYHTYRSDHSPKGFLDLCMARMGRLVFAELKRELGHLTDDQREWYRQLEYTMNLTEWVQVFVWRPSDWERVQEVLA